MADFGNFLAKHLSNELGCSISNVEKALSSFHSASVKTSSEKTNNKKPQTTNEKHTCERIPRGHKEPCGKRAKNSVEDSDGNIHWYCGTEKNGCYKSVLGRINREKEKKASQTLSKTISNEKKGTSTAKKGTSQKERKKEADIKSSILCNKVLVTKKFIIKRYKMKDGSTVLMDPNTRILFKHRKTDKDTPKAYAKLTKDEEIVDLNDKEIRFLETNNVEINTKNGKKKTKVKVEEFEEQEELEEDEEFEEPEDFEEPEEDSEEDVVEIKNKNKDSDEELEDFEEEEEFEEQEFEKQKESGGQRGNKKSKKKQEESDEQEESEGQEDSDEEIDLDSDEEIDLDDD